MDYVEDEALFTCPRCGQELPADTPVTIVQWGSTLRALCPDCWSVKAKAITN